MIEEAAGTRMYEYKKIAAQKTIEKKEAKLKEIKTVIKLKNFGEEYNFAFGVSDVKRKNFFVLVQFSNLPCYLSFYSSFFFF
jgi:hypothetical protein